MMVEEAFGIVGAARHARFWMPALRTDGQRLVFASLVLFMGRDSIAHPTVDGQLSEVTGYHPNSIRRILEQLREVGCIVDVGDRPVFVAGRAKGGRITMWAIPPAPSEAELEDSHPRPGAIPPAPGSAPTRASEGAPLGVEKLSAQETLGRGGQNGSVSISDQELWEIAERRAQAKGGGPGLTKTIYHEDRDDLEAEAVRRHAIDNCERCDSTGWVDLNDNTRAQCSHQAAAS